MSIVTLNDRGVRSVTTFGSLNTGSMVFIKKLTASSSATLSFVNGTSDVVLDSTYKEYLFTFKNIHPETDNANFQVNFRDGSTAYDATKTTTYVKSRHGENDSLGNLVYDDGNDLTQSTGVQILIENAGADDDHALSGTLHLFNPSSTTFVKHFISDFNATSGDDKSDHILVAGYCNVTAAIDAVQFSFASGNIDAGDICLYGIL
jgi:hypothetical protein